MYQRGGSATTYHLYCFYDFEKGATTLCEPRDGQAWPCARVNQAACLIPDCTPRILFHGGQDAAGTLLDDSWLLMMDLTGMYCEALRLLHPSLRNAAPQSPKLSWFLIPATVPQPPPLCCHSITYTARGIVLIGGLRAASTQREGRGGAGPEKRLPPRLECSPDAWLLDRLLCKGSLGGYF